MIAFRLPWVELAILLPLLGAFWVGRRHEPDAARRQSLLVAGLALACAAFALWDSATVPRGAAAGRWENIARVFGGRVFALDAVNGPLLPVAGLLYLLTILATLRTKGRRFSFAAILLSEAILLATLSCREPWTLIGLLAAGTIPPWVELAKLGKPTRVFAVHMILFVALLVAGQALLALDGSNDRRHFSGAGSLLLMAAVLVRGGIVPVHCWATELFEYASFGTALLFATPMVGAYAAVRLVLPVAPEWTLHIMALLSIVTALYAAGMALVQQEARRFFCYLFLSHSSLVFVGLETLNPIGLTGALCVWLSVGLSLGGFGLTLRSIEARTGRLSLAAFRGLYAHTPTLASLFLLTGLASIGFPGTIGFVGTELLVEGAVQANPLAGVAIVVATALNGLAVIHAYFRVFAGTRHVASIDLQTRLPERIAVLALTALLLGGGLYPQPGVAWRYNAAMQIVKQRGATIGDLSPAHTGKPNDPAAPKTLAHALH
jgi:NADH-quinone oxidoreductase subunit M